MNKFISTLLVIITLTLTLPKPEANAAVVVGGGLCAAHRDALCALDILIIAPAIAMAGIIPGVVIAVSLSTPLGYWVMGAGMVLDAENAQNGLAQSLAEKFSFIDDQEVINELSSGLFNRFHQEKDLYLATLDEASVRRILLSTDLSEEQVMTVVKELN